MGKWNYGVFRENELSKHVQKEKPGNSTSRSAMQFDCASSAFVEGLDYIIHTVLATDTFSGVCLRYSVKPIQLRRTNIFSGTNLLLAPCRLVIPLSKDGLKGGLNGRQIRLQDRTEDDYKVSSLLSAYPMLNVNEARAYLFMSNWGFDNALVAAKKDNDWENSSSQLQAWRHLMNQFTSTRDPLHILPNRSTRKWGKNREEGCSLAIRDNKIAINCHQAGGIMLNVHVAVEIELPRIGSYVAPLQEPQEMNREKRVYNASTFFFKNETKEHLPLLMV